LYKQKLKNGYIEVKMALGNKDESKEEIKIEEEEK
jgi:hypothetical protein